MTVDQMLQQFAADPALAEWADKVVSHMVPVLRARGWSDAEIVACFTAEDRWPDVFRRPDGKTAKAEISGAQRPESAKAESGQTPFSAPQNPGGI